ncbi:hypothetical protein CFBP6411_05552 [Pseudomonas syringae group genomosp. 3]|uniref:Uncharacterized protein n=1 Tax=Pseudomonas syringae group genomosp. 3 TaxID=251701 RepID=A0A2K4WLZ5_9PSED|nr:hypothetical protein [Pseudomonas syringae group genomosp. 3]SOS36909.1 hypothetical protein CFBP6411_05552 [Pseudomonas syringae group genomosp. 3]
MNKFLTPPTSAALRCERRQSGLLGGGNQPFAGESASKFYMPIQNFAGTYETDDYSAALYIVNLLLSKDVELSPEEYKTFVVQLRGYLQTLKTSANVPAEALRSLQQAAESIPEIGPLMFSLGNLPGTIASASGALMAAAKARKVTDLLDLTAEQKNKLHTWANTRGAPGATSAHKTFKNSIKIIQKNGKSFFKIPVTAVAQHYKILGKAGQQFAHIPLVGTSTALNQRAHLHSEGATGALKFMGGNIVGLAIATGPQAVLDYTSSSNKAEFYTKSVYSQPTNVASVGAGIVVGNLARIAITSIAVAGTGVATAGAAPLIAIILIGWGAGLVAQWAMAETGADKMIGDKLKKMMIDND